MAARSDVTLRFELSPRLAEIASGSDAINVQDSHDTLTNAQDSIVGSEYPDLVSTAGGENLGGGTSVGLTTTLDNVQYAFESTNPRSTGTATATDSLGITLTDSVATFQTDGVQRGDWVINFTDQSVTEILSVTSETELVTRGLRNGTANTFTSGDAYKVWEVQECTLSGGNFVAVDDVDAALNPLFTTFGRFATRTSSSSATLQELEDIRFASFNGGVTIDIGNITGNATSGVVFPTGTPRQPCDNFTDGLAIITALGLSKFNILGDATVDAGLTYDGYTFTGQGQNLSTITLDPAANILNCIFLDATVTGTLDGDCILKSCLIEELFFVTGLIENCILGPSDGGATITFAGVTTAYLVDCVSGVPGSAAPVLDMGGAGQPLAVRNYNGGIEIRNKTGSQVMTLDMNSGQVIFDSTVTTGDITVRGLAKYVNNGATANIVVDDLFEPIQVRELHRLQGLDINNPMNVTPTQRSAGAIDLAITGDGVSTSTVTRQ